MTIRQVLTGDAAALKTAIANSAEGDVVEVAGNFPNLAVNGPRFTKPGVGITIRPAAGAEHSFAAMLFQSLDGIHLRELRIKGTGSLAAVRNASVIGCRIGADPVPNEAVRKLQSKAMDILQCENVQVVGNEIAYVGSGISMRKNKRLRLALNDTHHFRADAYRGYSSNLTIARNIVSDLFRMGDEHVDAIQLWTTGILATDIAPHDVLIEGNWLERGGGDPSQSIFLANEAKVALTGFRVLNNFAAMGMWNGVVVYDTTGVEIRGNTVAGWIGALSKGQQMTPWIKSVRCTDVVNDGNVVSPLMPVHAMDRQTAFMRARRVADVADLLAA